MAVTFIPVAAAVVVIQVGSLVAGLGKSPGDFTGDAAATWQALLVLGNGFILTAVLWGWAMVAIIDRRLAIAGALFAVASALTLVGLIHSPLPSGGVFWPWSPPSPVVSRMAGAYGVLASVCLLGALGSGGGDRHAADPGEPSHLPSEFSE